MTGKPHNNTNPRKFKEKIELLRQKEAQLTANFMEVMRGIPTLTRNVVPYPDLSSKDLPQSDNYLPASRLSLDPGKSSGYTRRRGDSSGYQYALESSTGNSNHFSLYNNSEGGGGGGGGVGRTPRTDGMELQVQPRPPPPSQSQSRKAETKVVTSTESGKPGLLSHISPLHAPQTSSPSAYQPNLVPISVSPHSPQFYADSNTPPNRQHHPQFHQPPPPPPPLGVPEPASQQPSRGYACQSAWGLPGTQDCGSEPVGNALNNASTAASMIGDMSLVEYRRTYSDSCIPSSFPDVSDHSRCLPLHQQYHRQQNQPQPPPPQLLPPPIQQQRQQQRQHQRTLPPVDELTLPRYQNANSNTASNSPHSSCFNGSSLSSRCRHQSSTTVSQQPFRRLQSDYHSMRNIPQRYAPVHHHHHNPQQTAVSAQPLVMQPTAGGEGYAPAPIPHLYQTWTMNGSSGGGGGGGSSVSACDLPSSSPALRLKRTDVYGEYRAKPPALQLLPQAPQMATAMGYENHSARSGGGSSSSSDGGGGGGGYFGASTTDSLTYHPAQPSCTSSMLSSAAATTVSSNGGGCIAISSSAPLTQPLDISVLDSDAFPSPEQEGRRDSFSMAVDLLSRLEKRPLDSSIASSSASTASPPPPSLPTTTTTGTTLWNSSVACPPPSKSAKFDPTASTTETAASAFFVPIAANDLQLLTEPSMANYVTDAATEDQLVREQYSPT
ncbi:unnamed protein product [Hydatigera taeniaeformis]|uniref:TORC_N domain-containing protein n=1 Tax=Hydatigena taeniaeformis TaxID=6205 RepID=A0A158RF43_HYDTA|nr:unnamed protein product [Hydatigera taeniaeformis]